MMRFLFKTLVEQIRTNIPEILFMDEFNNQYALKSEDQEYPFNCPAIFFELSPMPWSLLGDGSQECEAELTFHLCTEDIDATFQINSEEDSQDPTAGLSNLVLADKIHEIFQGFSAEAEITINSNTSKIPICNQFNRVNTVGVPNVEPLKVKLITYKAMFYDYTTWKGFRRKKVENIVFKITEKNMSPMND